MEEEKKEKLQNLLSDMEFLSFFPKKVTKNDVIKITKADTGNKLWSLARNIIFLKSGLTSETAFVSQDSNGSSDEDETDDMYLSHLMVLFMCSDDLLRRYLVEKLQLNQMAVPFVLPDTQELLLWPLRIVRVWNQSNTIKEKCLPCTTMPIWAVVQVGESSSANTSKLLNMSFSTNQGSYRGFCESRQELVSGLVELGWYLPAGKSHDAWPTPITAINLHGNAASSCRQLKLLLDISDIVCVLVEDTDYDISGVSSFLIEKQESLLFLNKCSTDNDRKAFKRWLNAHNFENCSNISFKELENAVKKVKVKISKILVSSNLESLESRCLAAEKVSLVLDEGDEECCKSKEVVESIIKTIYLKPKYYLRKNILPMQEVWKRWSLYDKEQYRLKKLPSTMTSEKYLSELECKKNCIIEEILEMQPSQEFIKFLECLKESVSRKWFLEWFKLKLDEVSREVTNDIQERYLELSVEDPRSEKLKQLDDELAESSFGLEHFFREMAVMWKVFSTIKNQTVEWFPNALADVVLEGYPLELVDADAFHVPSKWINVILDHVKTKVGNKGNIFVVSILGVQSSGKSTFLNSMFGINFAVSSGRCTKGAFLQLVEVDKDLKTSAGCDYIAVIDTEGLKSSELSGSDYERDNELATLTIGVSDLSVINLSSENCESMKDILQIACYAFLRMTAVHNKPKCMMVHQKVSDPSAKKKNVQGKVLFLKTLDEMTKLAARMENASEKYSTFCDVIDYNPESMSMYIPGFWYGTPPMASVSADYACSAQQTKLCILKEMMSNRCTNLEDFGKRLEDLATAVMRENFIFSFQNTLTAKMHQLLRGFYINRKWELKNHVLEWLMNCQKNLKSAPESRIDEHKDILKKEGYHLVRDAVRNLQGEVEGYYEEHKEFSSELESCRLMIEMDMEVSKDCLLTDVEVLTDQFLKTEKALRKIQAITREKEALIKRSLRELKSKYSNTEIDCLQDEFESMWSCVVGSIEYPSQLPNVNIKLTMEQCLREYIKAHEKYLAAYDEDALFSVSSVDTYQETMYEILADGKEYISQLTSVPELFTEQHCINILRHINKKIQCYPSLTQHNRVNLMNVLSGFSIDKLEKMHEGYMKLEDPVQNLNCLKERYYDLLISGAQLENQVKLFCDELAFGILSSLKQLLPVYISKHIRDSCEALGSRTAIHLNILMDLEEKNNFEDFIKYIEHFKDYTLLWIRDKVITYMSEEVEGLPRVGYLLSYISPAVIDKLHDVMLDAAQDSDGVFDTFLMRLQERIVESKVRVDFDEQSIERMQILNVGDAENFWENLRESGKRRLQRCLQEKLEEVSIEEELSHMHPSIEVELYDLMMCEDGAQCPFCGVPCDRQGPHNEHVATMHQPQGLNNFRYENGQLVHEICTTLVASDIYFDSKESKGGRVKNKDYRRVYPNWDIKPSKDMHSSKFWKRFFTRFNKELSDYYKCQPAEIPEIWETYDWDAVKQQLEELFETTL